MRVLEDHYVAQVTIVPGNALATDLRRFHILWNACHAPCPSFPGFQYGWRNRDDFSLDRRQPGRKARVEGQQVGMFRKARLVCANVLVEREFEIRLLEVFIARFATVNSQAQVIGTEREDAGLLSEPDFISEGQELALALLLQPRCGARHFDCRAIDSRVDSAMLMATSWDSRVFRRLG